MILTIIIIGFETRNKRSLSFLDARTATLFKKSLWHSRFPVNFAKFIRTSFFTEHLWWLLLSLLTHRCDTSSLFLKGQGSSRSGHKQVQGAEMKQIQHCYNEVDIVAGLYWCCFSALCFLD